MAFKMKGFPMHKGISPMRMSKDDPSNNDPYSQTQANSALYGGEESGDKDANTNVENNNTNNAGFNDTKVDLDINGAEYFAGGPSLSSQNDLGIVGIWRTTA